MKIVTTTSVFPPCYDIENATERLSVAGFEGMDIALDYCVQKNDFPFMTENYLDWANALKKKSEELKLPFTHSHACFDASRRSNIVNKNFEVCALLGIPYTVVHPIFQKEDKTPIEDVDEFIKINAEAIKPILDIAEEYNVMALSENLMWGASIHPKNIAMLVEEVNSPYFGWCYDTGHANAFGIKPDVLKEISVVPKSLHIQDCHSIGHDEHLIPGDGNIDWKAFMRTLKEVGYKGDFVLEAHHQSLNMPDEERDEFFKEIVRRSRELIDFYQEL